MPQLAELALTWYADNARDLPWRREPDAWGVLVSEVMLQQTPVARVLPAYEAWMARWPAAGRPRPHPPWARLPARGAGPLARRRPPRLRRPDPPPGVRRHRPPGPRPPPGGPPGNRRPGAEDPARHRLVPRRAARTRPRRPARRRPRGPHLRGQVRPAVGDALSDGGAGRPAARGEAPCLRLRPAVLHGAPTAGAPAAVVAGQTRRTGPL